MQREQFAAREVPVTWHAYRIRDLSRQRHAVTDPQSKPAQVMPVLGLLLLFQYTVLLGPPPFSGLSSSPGWPLLALTGWFGAHKHLSDDMEARKLSL